MSWLSKLLGLDKHPQTLQAVNDIGHQLGTAAGLPTNETDLETSIFGLIDYEAAKVFSSVNIAPEEKGIATFLLSAGIKQGVSMMLTKSGALSTPNSGASGNSSPAITAQGSGAIPQPITQSGTVQPQQVATPLDQSGQQSAGQ